MNDSILCLELDGRSLPLRIRREGRTRSAHTGRELVELHGWLTTVDTDFHQWLTEALPAVAERKVRTVDEAGETTGKWAVSWNSYGETAGVHTYALILREAEELSLEALLIDGLELHPYEYCEEVVGDGLSIRAKMVGTEDDLKELRRLVRAREVFPVVRRGVQEEPREMRLGVAEWSPYEDRVKYRLVLVDEEINEEMRAALARMEEENGRAALGFYENLVERLTELLVARGVLSVEDVNGLREAARRELGSPRLEFWRVADVDAL